MNLMQLPDEYQNDPQGRDKWHREKPMERDVTFMAQQINSLKPFRLHVSLLYFLVFLPSKSLVSYVFFGSRNEIKSYDKKMKQRTKK